ncbi:mannonate dehydratase [Halogeometricum rufum]|uniref:mannonate dehydratase n=1 Tax=Halogeometricum rufum TaxID=553469 RepID=A0A1I6IFL6_9EURY|nr:mannonate dehydratase [Halogeometricum rufum]SFR65461.1 mannonate dehydratase [Halogeometricum rufum]
MGADSMRAEESIRLGMRTKVLTDARLAYLRQIGVSDVYVDPEPAGSSPETLQFGEDHVPSVERLERLNQRLTDAGLRFSGLHSIPISAYDKILFDEPGKWNQMNSLVELTRNLGRADIPILGYKWMAGEVQRTTHEERVRGGARAASFDEEDTVRNDEKTKHDVSEEELWRNYQMFLDEIVPVAEEEGVRLAVHPADPPLYEKLDGTASLLRNRDHFERAMDITESPSHGIKLCLGCFSEMGEDVVDVVRHFGERDEIVFVHFRDVIGTVPRFTETFLDDPRSNYDETSVIRALKEVGFKGSVNPDHVPRVNGDVSWDEPNSESMDGYPKGGPRARAYTAGYIRGLLRNIDREGTTTDES